MTNSVSSDELLLRLLQQAKLIELIPSAEILAQAKEGPIRFVSKRGRFTEREAIRCISEKLKVPFIDLNDEQVLQKVNESTIVQKVDSDFCWKHCMMPLYMNGGRFVLAVVNPLNRESIKAIEFSVGFPAEVFMAEELKIMRLLSEHLPRKQEQAKSEEDDAELFKGIDITSSSEEPIDEKNMSVVTVANQIIAGAIRERASDIHMRPAEHSLEVEYRVDGVMYAAMEVPHRLQHHLISRIKIMSGMDIGERRRPQDGRLRARISGENVDLRVSTVPTALGEKIVMRVLLSDTADFTFKALRLPETIEKQAKEFLNAHKKLMLVTGPTGSGKTSTLYTFLSYLKEGACNIATVEDPIEYRIPGITQIQVNESAQVTFHSVLRSVLRQDPDVIMIGEIRDAETANIALQAAETGHMVLSTLHTNDCIATLTRLQALGIEGYALASGVGCVLAQRLVRKLCENCRKPDEEIPGVYEAVGCSKCGGTGYRGRFGLFSFLRITKEIADLIHAGAGANKLLIQAKKQGFKTISDIARRAISDGITSIAEATPFIEIEEEQVQAVAPPVSYTPPQIIAGPGKIVVTPAPAGKQKVLIIEDDADMRQIIKMILMHENCEVEEACNGEEGLERAFSSTPDLILCDLQMPKMGGREFLMRIKNNRQISRVPIVILTADASDSNEVELLAFGARDFINKRSSAKVIAQRIRRALNPA